MPMEWSEFDSLEGWLCPNVPPGLGWWEEFEEEPELGWWGDFENNIVGHGHEVAALSHINNAAGVRVPLHSHGHADDQEIKQQQQEEEGRLLIQSTQPQQPRPGRRQQRKPGLAWTVKEHKLFLIGLSIFGKGDWKSISRMCVRSRNPTQVASHAQKYFKRRQTTTSMSSPGRRRRSSIHDTELDFSNFDSINTLLPNFPQILLYANNSSTISPSSVPPSIMPHPADHPHPN